MFTDKVTVMDKIRENKVVRSVLAIVFAIALAMPTALLSTPREAQAFTPGNVYLNRDGSWVNYAGYRTAHMTADDVPVYCAEPTKQPPSSGTYAKSALSVVNQTFSVKQMAAILYYGWGGPGFDPSNFPSTWFDGSAMDADKYWALTHILAADVYGANGNAALNGCDVAFQNWAWKEVLAADWTGGSFQGTNYDSTQWIICNELANNVPQSFVDSCYIIDTGNSSTQIVVSYEPYGWIDIDKDSSNTTISDGNDCYSLAGAQYGIYSNASCTNLVQTLTTNEDGYAKSGDLTPGTYYVKETVQAPGYDLDSRVYTVTVSGGSTTRVNGNHVYDNPQNDPGVIVLEKYDGEYEYSANNLPQGSATLAGAEFTVTYYDTQASSAEEVGYTDADNAGDYTRQWVYSSGDNGRIYLYESYKVGGDDLYYDTNGNETFPIGTYIIQETSAPEGYNLNNEIFVRNVTAEGTFESVETYNTPTVPEKVKRGDVEFQKMNNNDSERMANVPFLITSTTTGESHVVVTDENGYFSSSNDYNNHSYNTNANDAALIDNGDGTYSVNEELLDNTAGIYFGMNAEGEAVPQVTDEYGAFPYDTYTIQELPCSANEGLQLVSDQFRVSREGFTIDLGSIDDPNAYISTIATDKVDGDKYVVADPDSIINDRVLYNGLIEGEDYTLETTIVDLDNNNATVATGSNTFTADEANGYIDIEMNIDTTTLVEHDLAIIEILKSQDGREIASHNEGLDETEQTITVIPSEINTTATDTADSDKNVVIDPDTVINDQIDTTNFIPGEDYTAYGELMRILTDEEGNYLTNDDGSYQVEPFTINGEAVTNTIEFTASAASESVNMTFSFDATEYSGQTIPLVVFETITKSDDGWTVVEEKDPANVNQQVSLVPSSIGTLAMDGLDGDKLVVADPESSFVDTISYDNLIVGDDYNFGGIIMDADTHMPVLFGEGAADIDASRVQELMNALCDALHIDRIEFASNETTVVEDTEQSNEGTDNETVNGLEDLVAAFEQAAEDSGQDVGDLDVPVETPDQSILNFDATQSVDFEAVSRILLDYSDVVDHLGYTTLDFTPEKTSGSLDMTFEGLNTMELGGTNTVVFEVLAKDDHIITTHTDFTDEGQQVEIVPSEIGTTLTDFTDGDHYILPSTESKVVDTVEYNNVIPGKEYELTGTLMTVNETTGEEVPLYDAQGNEVTATTTFTPNQTSGTVELEFTFDSSNLADGQKVVAFEYLYKDDIEVAVHADINDESQTVWVGTPPAGDTFDKTGESNLPLLIAIGVLIVAAISIGAYGLRKHQFAKAATSVSDNASTLSDSDSETSSKDNE